MGSQASADSKGEIPNNETTHQRQQEKASILWKSAQEGGKEMSDCLNCANSVPKGNKYCHECLEDYRTSGYAALCDESKVDSKDNDCYMCGMRRKRGIWFCSMECLHSQCEFWPSRNDVLF